MTRRARFIFLFAFVLALAFEVQPSIAHAQAPIDPNLPDAPVAEDRAVFTPGFDVVSEERTPVAPLTAKQKMTAAFQRVVAPSILFRSAVITGYDEALDVGPDYGSGWEAAAKLYGYNTANIASTYMLADGVVPALFHQDPRYFRKESGPIKSRILYALRSEVVGYSDRGTAMPNYGMILGLGMSSALSNAYLPKQDISFKNTMTSYAIRLGVSAGFRVFSEFGGFDGVINRFRNR
jgi:hypothetical protein